MEQLIPLIVQLIGGAAGGNVVGALLKNANLSTILRTILGALAASAAAIGGADPGAAKHPRRSCRHGWPIVGNAGAAAVGGGLLTIIVGLIKQSMNKPAA